MLGIGLILFYGCSVFLLFVWMFVRWQDKSGWRLLTLEEQQEIRDASDEEFEEVVMVLLVELKLPALEEQKKLREAAHQLSIVLSRRLEKERLVR
ncbi:MAG: hypothetical protein AABY96_06860 [Nitrospirota bacterium]